MRQASITGTINYGWQDFTRPYSVSCGNCGTTLNRSVKGGCNMTADRDYIERLRERLRVEAEEESKKPVICDGCRRSAITSADAFSPLSLAELAAAGDLTQTAMTAVNQLTDFARTLSERYEGRIVQHQGDEWVISSVYAHVSGWSDHNGLEVRLDKLNKRRPWERTNTDCIVKLDELLISPSTIEQREAAAAVSDDPRALHPRPARRPHCLH